MGCGLVTGMVGWWKFDDGSGTTVTDSSGSGNTGTLNNGVSGTWSASVSPSTCLPNPYCMDFSAASNSWVGVPNASSLVFASGDQISIAAWVYPTASDANGVVVCKIGLYSGLSGQNYTFSLLGLKAGFYYDDASTGQQFESSVTLTLNTWQHIAFTYTYGTGSTAKMYINGVQDTGASWTSGSGNISPANVAVPVTIGDVIISGTPGTAIHARLDDLRLYKGVTLTLSQIQVIASTTPTPPSGWECVSPASSDQRWIPVPY